MKVLILCALLAFASCQLPPIDPLPLEPLPLDPLLITTLLDLHNKERALVGVPPLVWNPAIQITSQAYVTKLALTEKTEHSGQPYVGENIAAGTTRDDMTAFLFSLWSGEKDWFIPGCTYPDCSSSGLEVGHYTQVVWRNTLSVGCGELIDTAGWTYLVCQYFPYGNVQGQKVY